MISPSSLRARWGVVALVLLLVAGGMVVVYRTLSSPTRVHGAATAATGGVRVVDIPAGKATDVRVDRRWTIHVPAGGVAVPSKLTVEPVSERIGPTGSTPLTAARLRLSSGQPTAPWTFTLRLDEPLPPEQTLYLLDDSGDGAAYGAPDPAEALEESVAPAEVHIAALSADRRLGTVPVSHLSFKEWLTDVAGTITSAIGSFFGQRSTAPTCEGQRPQWLSDAVFLDDQNGPMRVCVGADPANPDIAVVKIANNRVATLLVTAPTSPTWAWQSFVGAEAESWLPNLLTHVAEYLGVPAAEATRTWVLPPGQEVHLGFAKTALAGGKVSAEITSRLTPTSIALGLASKIASQELDEDSRAWDFVLMASCLQSVGARAFDDQGASAIGQALAGLARCAVEQPETLVAALRGALPTWVWQSKSGPIYRAANGLKRVLSRYLLIAELVFTIADIAGTLTLPRSAFTVTLFLRVAGPKTKIVTVVGITGAGDPAPGFTVEPAAGSVENCSDSPAATTPGIVMCLPHAEGADVCWVRPDAITLLCGGMPWDKELTEHHATTPVGTTAAAADPNPWGLELTNGLRCRLRNGGAWGGRADGYVGAYFCDDEKQFILVTADEPLLDKSEPQWTVKVGELGSDSDDFPPPTAVPVLTAYYAGAP